MSQPISAKASEILQNQWIEICILAEQGGLEDRINDPAILESIRSMLHSTTNIYHYVLPTQLVAKLADFQLDCRCIQAGREGPGSFDARSVADDVIVPFDQRNERVLGGAPEPYVNKPLRFPEFSGKYRGQQKKKQD